MRTILGVLLGALAAGSAQAGDLALPPAYGAAPPPAYGAAPPPAYGAAPPAYVQGPPPVVAYGPPPYPPATAYVPPVYPRGVITAPQGPGYVVPGPVYQPSDEYVQAPALVDARRYYRECWWEFGYRRCALRHKAWFW
jgi:hypothetical protein